MTPNAWYRDITHSGSIRPSDFSHYGLRFFQNSSAQLSACFRIMSLIRASDAGSRLVARCVLHCGISGRLRCALRASVPDYARWPVPASGYLPERTELRSTRNPMRLPR